MDNKDNVKINNSETKRKICYCRVSTLNQKDDLEK